MRHRAKRNELRRQLDEMTAERNESRRPPGLVPPASSSATDGLRFRQAASSRTSWYSRSPLSPGKVLRSSRMSESAISSRTPAMAGVRASPFWAGGGVKPCARA
jgi:hypothetical protein